MIRTGFLLLAAALVAGCATGGQTGALPAITQPTEAAYVTIYRDGSLVGLFATIKVRIDGREVYRLGRNEQYSFRLDPGQYLVDFSIGLNECRRAFYAQPGRNYRFRLVPNCMVVEDVDGYRM
jgi:hypothetical protein